MEQHKFGFVLGLTRIAMGWLFLWAFLDKTFGLGFATAPEKAWIVGGSPTSGFLQFVAHGPFAEVFHSLANVPIVDWLYMVGFLFIGLSLLLGIFTRLSSFFGIIILVLIYGAVGIWPANNPFLDDHLIYILILLLVVLGDAGQYIGLGKWWESTSLVQKFKFLK